MKYIAVLFLALIASSYAHQLALAPTLTAPGKKSMLSFLHEPMRLDLEAGKVSLCSPCVQLMDQGAQQLINIIANSGVVGGCGALCALLPPTVPTILKTVCDIVCDIAGIDAMVWLLKNYVYIDPIYFCEVLKLCPVVDGGAAKVNSVICQPSTIKQGDTVTIEAIFTILNATGTGLIGLDVVPPTGSPIGSDSLSTGLAPGQYGVKAQLETKPSQDQPFEPGTYKVEFDVCEGMCGDHPAKRKVHPHSALLAEGTGQFAISK